MHPPPALVSALSPWAPSQVLGAFEEMGISFEDLAREEELPFSHQARCRSGGAGPGRGKQWRHPPSQNTQPLSRRLCDPLLSVRAGAALSAAQAAEAQSLIRAGAAPQPSQPTSRWV